MPGSTSLPSVKRGTAVVFDQEVRAWCDEVRIEDNVVGHWLQSVIASKTKDAHADTRTQQAELQRQDESIAAKPDQLLHMRIERQYEQRGR